MQPLFKGKVGDIDTVVFFAIDGIKPEIRLKKDVLIESEVIFKKEYKNGETIITDFTPGFNCRFLIDGKLRIIVLNESESLNFTSVNIDNENYLLLSDNNSIIFSESGLIKIFTENEAEVNSFPEILNLPSKIENLKPDINTISLIKSENKITEDNLYTYYLYD
ncbi:MAG: hypothetical protein E7564_11790, partial [Ruminococcaceae bacterium]|nr:hypothetical protein [Oscillospiraceae bacterium]